MTRIVDCIQNKMKALSNLKKVLGITDCSYENYKHFNRKLREYRKSCGEKKQKKKKETVSRIKFPLDSNCFVFKHFVQFTYIKTIRNYKHLLL